MSIIKRVTTGTPAQLEFAEIATDGVSIWFGDNTSSVQQAVTFSPGTSTVSVDNGKIEVINSSSATPFEVCTPDGDGSGLGVRVITDTATNLSAYTDCAGACVGSRIDAFSFHTNGTGCRQIFIEGNAIDASGGLLLGQGLAGGQSTSAVFLASACVTGGTFIGNRFCVSGLNTNLMLNNNTSGITRNVNMCTDKSDLSLIVDSHRYIQFNTGSTNNVGRIVSTGGNLLYQPFTGSHLAKKEEGDEYEYEPGMIVVGTGKMVLSTLSDSFPYVKLSTTANDSAVFGVYDSAQIEDDDPVNGFQEGEESVNVLAVGEGGVLVTNYNGDVNLGDLVTTSGIRGLGMRQTERQVMNYTVAKVVGQVEWSAVTCQIEYPPQSGCYYKKTMVPIVFKI